MDTLRIVTRKSPLALKQTALVAQQFAAQHPQIEVTTVAISSEGDEWLASPLSEIGGKGLFVKSLERALLEDRADVAVHSMKDVPCELPAAFTIVAALKRANPADAFVSKSYQNIEQLPQRAVVGTASLRRLCQLKYHYPHLEVQPLRGNVGTRLGKLDSGAFDALILAAAGLERLGLEQRITQLLPHRISLPAIGQGVIGIECLADHPATPYLAALNDPISAACLQAERALSLALGGDCTMPLAAYAYHERGVLHLKSLLGDVGGKKILVDERSGSVAQSVALGAAAAAALLAQGGAALIAPFRNDR